MDYNEIQDRIVAIYQTYNTSLREARYRTALVWRQPDPLVVDGQPDPYVVWTVTSDSTGVQGQAHGHRSEQEAAEFGRQWVGSDRQVSVEKMSLAAWERLYTAVTGKRQFP